MTHTHATPPTRPQRGLCEVGRRLSQAKKLGDVTTLNLTMLKAGVSTGLQLLHQQGLSWGKRQRA